MTTTTQPKLAPPGAGLPRIELFIARILFGIRLRTGNRDAFTTKFQAERGRIRELLRGFDAATGSRQVLIRRPPGLEDSSRNWSMWMTFDHLRIIHGQFIRIIRALTSGEVPEGQASTAAVKPSPDADASAVDAYESSCEALLAVVAAAPDLQTTVRFVHPWFGPLNAFGWYALAGSHLAIHRVQMERIIAGLSA